MNNGTEPAPAIWETKNAIKDDDSFDAKVFTLTEDEASKITATLMTLGGMIR